MTQKLVILKKKITEHKPEKYITTPEFTCLPVENQLKKLETFDSICFRGKNRFEEDGTQNCLVFQQINRYFKITPTTNTILSWKSKGLPDDTVKPSRPHTVLAQESSYVGNKTRVKFNGCCLTQNKIIFYQKKQKKTKKKQ